MKKHKILYILNDYSYFKKVHPSGPKSLIKLVNNLSKYFTKNIFFIKTNLRPRKLILSKNQKIFFFKNLISIIFKGCICKPDIIIVDRGNIILGLIIKFFIGSKIVIRFLGYSNRLNSLNLFSYKNLVIFFLRIIKCDLTIQTIDMFFNPSKPLFLGDKNIIRFNGLLTNELYPPKYKNNYGITFVGRLDDTKGIDKVINFFENIYQINNHYFLDILGFTKNDFVKKYSKSYLLKKINFHGFVNTKKKSKILRKNKFYISGQNGLLGNSEIEAIYNSRIILLLKNLNFNSKFLCKKNFLELENYIQNKNFKKIEIDMKKKKPKKILKKFFEFEKIHNFDSKSVIDLLK